MLNFYKLENKNEKQKAYNAIRDIVLKDFSTATLQETKEGFYILWYGVAISEVSKTAYDAWLDLALPY
jgi:hypothetical protein